MGLLLFGPAKRAVFSRESLPVLRSWPTASSSRRRADILTLHRASYSSGSSAPERASQDLQPETSLRSPQKAARPNQESDTSVGNPQDDEIRKLLAEFGDESIAADNNAIAGPSRTPQRKKALRKSDTERGDMIEDYATWEQYAKREALDGVDAWDVKTSQREQPGPAAKSPQDSGAVPPPASSSQETPSTPPLDASQLATSLRNHLDTLSASTASKARALRHLARERTLELSDRAGQRARTWRQDLERQLGLLGGRINGVTGYDEVERMKEMVREREDAIAALRETASSAKAEYDRAVSERSAMQRDIQLLLERKDTWDDGDVLRFTKLVRSGHAANLAVSSSKSALQTAEAEVEKAFDSLMKGILERYHEEQVWSDKIRSVSTYGSLAVLVVNLVVFLGAIAVVEPWKRRRLVRGLEERVKGLMEDVEGGVRRELSEIKQLVGEARNMEPVAAAPLEVIEPVAPPKAESQTAVSTRALEWTRRQCAERAPRLLAYVPTDAKAVDVGVATTCGGFIAGALATTLMVYARTTR